jgi:ATP-dependent Clp protease protease subunit
VETICLGQAGASAAVLLAAGTPGKRSVLPGARIVLQQPSLPQPVQGQPSDLVIKAAELDRIRALLEELLVRHTGRAPAQVHQDLERDLVLDAQAALAYGLVDRIVPSRRTSLGLPDAG